MGALARVAFIESIIGVKYQTEEVQQHDRRHDPSVKFAKQCLFFLRVDVDIILNGVVLLLVCRVWCIGRRLFHLEIHCECGSGPLQYEAKAAKPRMLMVE